MTTQIKLQLAEGALDQLQHCDTPSTRGGLLVTMIDQKIEEFQTWSRRHLGDSMTKFEIAAIRTFLYRELTGELAGEGDIMNLPRVPLVEHPASAI